MNQVIDHIIVVDRIGITRRQGLSVMDSSKEAAPGGAAFIVNPEI